MDLNSIPQSTLEKLTNQDLDAIAAGNLEGLSNAGLLHVEKALQSQPTPAAPPQESLPEAPTNDVVDGVPKWGRENPNIYAGIMTGLDILPMAASFAKSTGIGIPVAGAINMGAKSAQRAIAGEDATPTVRDFAKGALVEGSGRALAGTIKAAANMPAVREKLNDAGKWLYQSAMKFSTSPNILTPAERSAITETGLKYKLGPNEESYLRLGDIVKGNSGQVDDIVKAATANGDMIPTTDAMQAGSLGDLLTYGKTVRNTAPGYADDVAAQVNTFTKDAELSPLAMNLNKKQLQADLKAAYGNNTLNTSSAQTKKQIASGIKTVLEQRYPEIAQLNAESHELLNLSEHLARSMGRAGNRDVIGLGDKILLDMVTNTTQNGGGVGKSGVWMLMSALDRPQVKARLAQALYKANTGKNLPIAQWKKGLKYVGDVAAPTARAGFESALYTVDGVQQ